MKRIVKISITSRQRARVTETLTTTVRPSADHAASDPSEPATTTALGVSDDGPPNAGQPTSGGSPKDFDSIPEEDLEI